MAVVAVMTALLVAPTRATAQGAARSNATSLAALPLSLTLRTLTGDSVRIRAGEPPILIALFATWCRTCRDEVALLGQLQRELAPRGIRVVAVSVDEADDAHVQRWLTARGASYAAGHDATGTIARALGAVGVPEVHLVGRDGRVLWSRRGPLEPGLAGLRAAAGRTGS
jgi:cytochrome oxidase Cu insertion factor (SCO1/SenC/PrrC family)